ncbi:MAG: DUF3791 domain-containing protein [Spirochaetota bacterium]|nr:DUF3791 domain-containing protein [Spirochaetota bacterium]
MNFTVFCLESYKTAYRLTGKEVINIFDKYNVINYIESFYDVLHSTGQEYIVADIDKFIKSRKNNSSG